MKPIGILACTFELLHMKTLLPIPVVHCILETLYKEALLDEFTAIQAPIIFCCVNFKSFNVTVTVRTTPAETVYSCEYIAVFIKLLFNDIKSLLDYIVIIFYECRKPQS